jgi:hypothetical protein
MARTRQTMKGQGRKKEDKFEPTEPEQKATHDDLETTKLARKEAARARFAGIGGVGSGGAGTSTAFPGLYQFDSDDSSDLENFGGKAFGAAFGDSSDEEGGHGIARPKASRGAGGARGLGALSGFGAWTKANLEADFRKAQSPAAGQSVELPTGIEVAGAGGEAMLEEQEDGAQALVLPEGSHLQLSLRCSPFILQEDGRLHDYSVIVAMRLDRLPSSSMPILNGGAAPDDGEKVENVQVYKNGGVGALGHMGTQEAALRADRWAWVAITRSKGVLRTYVNGHLCAEVPLPAARPPK